MNVDQVTDLAQALLDCIVAGFDAAGVDLPARRFLWQGEVFVAPGCEQLVVTGVGLLPAVAGQVPRNPVIRAAGLTRSVLLEVWLSRCVATVDDQGNVPSPAEANASADVTLRDLWTLPNVIISAIITGCFGDLCDRYSLDTVEVEGPSGGMSSTRCNLILQLVPTIPAPAAP